MKPEPANSFTHDRKVREDGAVTFRCSSDHEKWPFLALPPHHPIVVQTLQYWASVESSIERGIFDGSKWTALTWTKWRTGVAATGHAAHGISEQVTLDGKLRHKLAFFDAEGELIYEMFSAGVVFQNRDFEAWRAKEKKDSVPQEKLGEFTFAPPKSVGSDGIGPSFLAPLEGSKVPRTMGLISKENGLPPTHPFMSGSGDHVNSTHLAEAGHQFLHLLVGGAPLIISGGEMEFSSYVELGRPFQIELAKQGSGEATMVVSQAGKVCTTVTLSFERR